MANKTDIVTKEELSEDNKKIFETLETEGVPVFWTSTGKFPHQLINSQGDPLVNVMFMNFQ